MHIVLRLSEGAHLTMMLLYATTHASKTRCISSLSTANARWCSYCQFATADRNLLLMWVLFIVSIYVPFQLLRLGRSLRLEQVFGKEFG